MQKAGMSIREDAMGNIWARWKGADADAGELCGTIAPFCLSCWQAATTLHAPGNHYCKNNVEARPASKMSMVKHKGHKVLEAP